MDSFHYLSKILEISRACPARCEYCQLADQPYQPSNQQELQVEPPRSFRWVTPWVLLGGGDAYAWPELNHKIETLKNQSFSVALTTSGLLFKDQSVDYFSKADLVLLPIFSIDSKQHNYRMGIDSFDRLLEIGRQLRRKNKKVVFNFLVDRTNILEMDEVEDFWKEKGFFCMLRPRSALGDVPGFSTDSLEVLKYIQAKPNFYLYPGEDVMRRRLDPPELVRCLACEAWLINESSHWLLKSLQKIQWNLFVRKVTRFYQTLKIKASS